MWEIGRDTLTQSVRSDAINYHLLTRLGFTLQPNQMQDLFLGSELGVTKLMNQRLARLAKM